MRIYSNATSVSYIFFIFNRDRRREIFSTRQCNRFQLIRARKGTRECSLPVQLSVIVKTHLRNETTSLGLSLNDSRFHRNDTQKRAALCPFSKPFYHVIFYDFCFYKEKFDLAAIYLATIDPEEKKSRKVESVLARRLLSDQFVRD